ncbi:MAG: ABC transporter ATP-binding protein [Clostridia bacterium]|nr:ABC transporter ATP-binding protein [Clostridia bacterium]
MIIETTDLLKQYKQYDSVINAVDRVNLKVEDGEFLAIIGASGSGKTTLLHLLSGLERPNYGTINFLGENITEMSNDRLARFRGENTGVVFQRHNLIPQLTALENILVPTVMCGKPDQSYQEHLKKLIITLKIGNRLGHLPSELSGGQQQRVAIARALINRPKVLFADEPTGNLDRKNADEVLDLLLNLKSQIGQTLIMVTHDMSIADRADKIYMMDDGKLYLYKDKQGYYKNYYELEKSKHN